VSKKDKKVDTILVFIIQAYDKELDNGGLENVCTLELIDNDYKSALKTAKKIVKKHLYRLSGIIEKEVYDCTKRNSNLA